VNQCQPIDSVGFVKGLTTLFNGTLGQDSSNFFLFSDSILKQDYCAAPSQTVSISVPQIFSFHRHLFTLDTSFSPPSLIKQKQGSNFQEKVLNS